MGRFWSLLLAVVIATGAQMFAASVGDSPAFAEEPASRKAKVDIRVLGMT